MIEYYLHVNYLIDQVWIYMQMPILNRNNNILKHNAQQITYEFVHTITAIDWD